jgi:predicted GNAT family acetyltransferase
VPEISVAAVWAGPSIDDVGNAWEEDATIRDLVARLAARRTPLDDAQKVIADVITGIAGN